jgi:hypothetical protein
MIRIGRNYWGYVSIDCQLTEDNVKLGFSTQHSYDLMCTTNLQQPGVLLITGRNGPFFYINQISMTHICHWLDVSIS